MKLQTVQARPVPPLSRRRVLQALASGVALTLLPGCGDDAHSDGSSGTATEPSTGGRFLHGVASGDPLADAVILWTRVTPDNATAESADCHWSLYTDAALRDRVAEGAMPALAAHDWCVKLDVGGLAPDRHYWYRFRSGAHVSPVGRTRTAPQGEIDALRLAFVTCGDYSRGFFHAYRRVAEREDLAVVVHLGDYLYESGRNDVRAHDPPHELLSLDDYRRRYAQYRSDADLQSLHAAHPMIWIWDDHEIVNDAWKDGADNHDPQTEGDYLLRRATAAQVAHEWLPIRSPSADEPTRIYRRFAFGDLVELIAIDARHVGRDAPVPANSLFGAELPVHRHSGAITDPARQILGVEQEAWLLDALATTPARWRLIANQVIFSPLVVLGAPRALGTSLYLSADKWDGFPAARDRVLAGIRATRNVVIFTGDAHESYAFDVTDDPNNPASYGRFSGEGAAAAEFVAPSITSRGDAEPLASLSGVLDAVAAGAEQLLGVTNPHLKFFENTRNGYVYAEVDANRLVAEFWHVPRVREPTADQTLAARFEVQDGRPGVVRL
ncbi:alkaline phosphatase D family protein [Sinimarinibacterium flocculans]|uniref:Alkaline phosphatase D n=1 Tax=Sinimarinibacterium flocculans TaxID=985250 RepID=A0A318E1A1_9GAMM|nr:alkaline phosphatase D family protein [Sinimarinibacterium flocculans]PXV64276.1 alkaline phosphatase D [Sinimarinibacterium flocculans]